ncbi:MAG TPA: hypothetical protein VJ974_04705 [Geopsychrobacteraceae bacterium]|nr:hypothetical protein [Geopsychrobacteraceae bacterium]
MKNCTCGGGSGAGPFSEGRELVEFVYNAHGGGLRLQNIPGGGLATVCQGCGTSFTLLTFIGTCPDCRGVHAISPPRASDPFAIQFAGKGFSLSEI